MELSNSRGTSVRAKELFLYIYLGDVCRNPGMAFDGQAVCCSEARGPLTARRDRRRQSSSVSVTVIRKQPLTCQNAASSTFDYVVLVRSHQHLKKTTNLTGIVTDTPSPLWWHFGLQTRGLKGGRLMQTQQPSSSLGSEVNWTFLTHSGLSLSA